MADVRLNEKGQKRSGQHKGSGYVYVMKHQSKGYKIGCTSRDVKERLKEIQRDYPETILLDDFKSSEMNSSKTRAQDQVKEKLHMKRNGNTGTDWFIETDIKVSVDDVIEVVQSQRSI